MASDSGRDKLFDPWKHVASTGQVSDPPCPDPDAYTQAEFDRLPTNPEVDPSGVLPCRFQRRRTEVEVAPVSGEVDVVSSARLELEGSDLEVLDELTTLADELEFDILTSELACIEDDELTEIHDDTPFPRRSTVVERLDEGEQVDAFAVEASAFPRRQTINEHFELRVDTGGFEREPTLNELPPDLDD